MQATGKDAMRRLPPGSHGIPADVVARNQRERLIAAMAEVCAERGYARSSVAEIAKRAGISSVTFYKQFEGKQACMLAAHRQLLGRLLETVDQAVEEEARQRSDERNRDQPGGGEDAGARATIHAALALLSADPPSARLLTVEVLAAGPEGVKRHAAMVEAVARRLRGDGDPSGGAPVSSAEWVHAAGVLALVGKLVTAGEAECLPELDSEIGNFP